MIGWGFCDIRNNQGRGKCYKPKPKAKAYNTYTLITKTELNNCFIIHCFKENYVKRIIAANTLYFRTLKNLQLCGKQIFTWANSFLWCGSLIFFSLRYS